MPPPHPVHRGRRTTLALLAATLLTPAARPAHAAGPDVQRRWIVTPQQALELVRGGALLLDARVGRQRLLQRSLGGAVAVAWQDLAMPEMPLKGRLLADDALLTRRLQALGVWRERAVVVAADPDGGWGEEGRIVWLLRALGHPRAVMVDGGVAALRDAGEVTVPPVPTPGDFVVARVPAMRVDKDEIRADLARPQPRLVLLDTREPREYEGATPYDEARGGHIPGARPLWFKTLLDADGRLKPRAEIERLLAQRGVTRDSELVAYCTAGIRSAWVVAVLSELGYKARNYDGSIWEWAAAPAAGYPLDKGR